MRVALLAIAALAALTGCFTGVESTPRITVPADEARAVTPEDTFLNAIAPERPAAWSPGKRFHITDNRFKLLLGASAPEGDVAGHEIELRDMGPDRSPTGDDMTRLTFVMTGDNRPMVYSISGSPDDVRRRTKVEIPFAIDMKMVADADALLRGRRLWVLTPAWRDANDALAAEGRRYVAVTVDSVLPGTTAAPLRVVFTEVSTGRTASLFVSPEAKGATPRTFARQFALADPRSRYADITPEHWKLITEGRLAAGMTRRECRLALGSPADITRRTNYSIMQERWTYENGVWLLFEDDTLIDFRK